MKKPVISSSNLPTALPLWKTIVLILLLREFNAPAVVWVIATVVMFFVWLGCSIAISAEHEVEVFPGQDEAIDERESDRIAEFHKTNEYPLSK